MCGYATVVSVMMPSLNECRETASSQPPRNASRVEREKRNMKVKKNSETRLELDSKVSLISLPLNLDSRAWQ